MTGIADVFGKTFGSGPDSDSGNGNGSNGNNNNGSGNGNGNGDARHEQLSNCDNTSAGIIPTVDLDPHIPDRDYAEYYINTAKKTVRKEDALVRQVFYAALSKDSDDPLNLSVLATTSEGKTYGILQTLQYFPDKEIWYIGSMSPKVIVRQRGILVDSEYNPLKPRLIELKKEIRRAQQNGNLDREEQLKAELDELKEGAKVLIELKGQCLVFLEPPHTETWNILKATLSHDRYEIEHPYVYEVPGFGFTVKNIVTRGWPSCIFASARNESKWAIWPEIQSRFLVISPNMVPEKVHEGNILISQKMSLPNKIQNIIIVSPQERELAKKCAMYLVQHIKNTMTQEPDKQANPFWIPYGLILGEALPWEKGTDNRITKRIFSFLRMITLSRAHLRCRLQYGDENLIIASLPDLHEALHIMQNLSGIPNYKLSMYREYYLPCYQLKYKQQNGQPDVSKDGKKEETVFGLSNKEFCDYYKKETGKILNTRTFRETYVEEWYNNGLIEEAASVIDTRQKIHYPIILLSPEPISKLDNNDAGTQDYELPKIKPLGVSTQSPIFLQPKPVIVQKDFKEIPKNWLELQILELLRWEFQEDDATNLSSSYEQDRPAISRILQIYDEKGSKICVCQFYDKYSHTWTLDSYFSNGISYEKSEKYNGPLKYLDEHQIEDCKIIGVLPQTPNRLISDVGDNGLKLISDPKLIELQGIPDNDQAPPVIPEVDWNKVKEATEKARGATLRLTYEHLIEIENLPTIGQYYRCKEHPDIWNKDLNGLEESHFKPFHTDRQGEAKGEGNN